MNVRSILRFVLPLMLVAAIALVSPSGGQAQKRLQKVKPRKATAAQIAKAKADSLVAAAKADSLARVARERALQDSIRVAVDSVARFQDSLKAAPLRKLKNEAFGVGERLVFEVNYGFITAGEAVMEVTGYDSVAGHKCYRVEFTVNSVPSFSWVYKVEDRYLTFIDVETLAPWKFEQHIREGTYRRDFIAEFDQVNRVARTTEGNFPTPQYVHDIMSAFYYARIMDFSTYRQGDGILLSNFYKDKSYDLKVNFLGRQELETEAGTFNTIVVEPLVKEGGLFKSEGRIVIWLSDDERKIPVRVNTKIVIGSIDTELKSYSGLIGPLRGRIR
jgi:hypothetical protein